MATNRGNRARQTEEVDNTITYVQCDGLAAMKIVKHCHEESSNMDLAQGALLGLVVDKCLEITNCFPFPKNEDDTMDEELYQLAMMRRLRRVNVDHFHVGWYQSSNVGNFLSMALLESQYHYQTSIEESVVVIYDTQKSGRGFLCLKAYRLTPQAIQMYKDGDFTPEALRNMKVGYESLFVEIPIVIKNSPLTNIMVSELCEMMPEEQGHNFLDLGTASVLESHMRCLIERVDELYQESMRYNKYQQAVFKQETEKHRALTKQTAENAIRVAKGESPVPEEEVLKQFRPLPVPPRLNATIASGQINTYSQHISQFCSQSLAKLFITQSLQNAKESKDVTK
ncbi:eukaryotic translation initiation factor 3 subunit H [Musca vetustissima]|uniref:eukaryotic translation initiation factor 3 subunit H-like n=1 Tax=Musca vetustissima TaxID=27455 RepID=UPI002AB6CFC6|nr:eukaryotic translation initiation factor 3 subunit H-like [Musca vetustissima]XP_061402436.1 eukaryotic translation initiation factor 3 subunit H [Musca vetustissima]